MALLSEEEPFDLFTSLRYDRQLLESPENSRLASNTTRGSPLYMLRHHRDRILEAAKNFDWAAAVKTLEDLSAFEAFILTEVKGFLSAGKASEEDALRARIVCTRVGALSATFSVTPPVPLASLYPQSLSPPPSTTSPPAWTFHPDTTATTSTAFTRFKTTSRDMYITSRVRVSIPSLTTPAEVLMFNEAGEMSEGSLTSIYFLRDGTWVTPPVGSGGQEGTTRRWALETGLCGVWVVRVEDVCGGEVLWVSNGVRGFIKGRVVLGAFVEGG